MSDRLVLQREDKQSRRGHMEEACSGESEISPEDGRKEQYCEAYYLK